MNAKLVSVTQAAEIRKVTPQAIRLAIKLKRLKAEKIGNSWIIRVSDLNSVSDNRRA